MPEHLRESVSEQRMVAAAVRAVDALIRCRLKAAAVCEAMDETTSPHGIRVAGLDEEDSMVTTIDSVRRSAAAVAGK